jgi:hypothetical protein
MFYAISAVTCADDGRGIIESRLPKLSNHLKIMEISLSMQRQFNTQALTENFSQNFTATKCEPQVSHGSRRFDTPIFLIFLVMNAADPVT